MPLQTIPSGTSPSRYLSDSYVFMWGNLSLRTDRVFLVAIAICLGAGLAAGHPAGGMIAAGGAMLVGLGAKNSIDDSPLLPMIFASLGMSFSTFVGMAAGHDHFILVPIVAVWGFGYGMLSHRPSGYEWVGQQCVVSLLVASAFPFSVGGAAVRALLLLAGGAVQILCVGILLRLLRELRADLVSVARYVRTEQLLLRAMIVQAAQTLRGGRTREFDIPYALRVAITLAVATEIYTRMHFASGYWIAMTALLVLKPGLTDTANRAIARTLGTLAGAVLISFLIAHVSISFTALAALTLVFAWLSYGTLHVNYALYSLCITAYIVFLLSLDGISSDLIAEHRAICTAIGGALALTVRLTVIRHRKRQRVGELASQQAS